MVVTPSRVGRGGPMRVQVLVDYFDLAVSQLIEAGAPAETIIDALKVVTTRTELLHGRSEGLKRLDEVAKRLKAIAEGAAGQAPLMPNAHHPVIPEDADLLRRVADIMRETDN